MHGAQRPQARAGEGMGGSDVGCIAEVARSRTKTPVEGEADIGRRHLNRRHGPIEQHERGARRDGREHGTIGAGLCAQESGELVGRG